MEKFPQRKTLRLQGYDYSQQGMYYITICTKNREQILSKIIRKPILNDVGVDDPVHPNTPKHITKNNVNVGTDDPARPMLTDIGRIIENCIKQNEKIYKNVIIDEYVIMPDHVHMIIFLTGGQSRPPLQKIIQGFKSVTTRNCFKYEIQKLWQRNYYEHIIRNEKEYFKIKKYILENPIRWYRKGIANEITNPNCNIYNNNTSNNNGSIRIYNNANINNKHTNQLRYNPKQCDL